MKYELGKTYTINPFNQKDKWDHRKQKLVPYNGDEAEFTGWIKLKGNNKLPVFKFDFYTYGDPTCFMVLENGRCVAAAGTVEGMLADFHRQIEFEGDGYTTVQIGQLKIPKAQFISEAKATSMKEEWVQKCVKAGRYDEISGKWGKIKYCPTCAVLRDTTCSACGCGNCKSCGFAWTCLPPGLLLPRSAWPIDYWDGVRGGC